MDPSNRGAPALPQLILRHSAQLTDRTVEQVRAQVPWYQDQTPDVVRRMVNQDYQMLAQMLQNTDVVTLRAYIEKTGLDRLQTGAQAENLIAVAALMEENVRRLIDTEMLANPTLARDATRRVQSLIRNIRMILSGLNLRRLVGERPPPR